MNHNITLPPEQPLETTKFRWRTHDGQHLHPSQMETRHLVYSLRMIWNHLCPEQLRVPGGNRWGGIERMGAEYLRTAVVAMMKTALQRKDLTKEYTSILNGIANGMQSLREFETPELA